LARSSSFFRTAISSSVLSDLSFFESFGASSSPIESSRCCRARRVIPPRRRKHRTVRGGAGKGFRALAGPWGA
jgi:hypothetical protein